MGIMKLIEIFYVFNVKIEKGVVVLAVKTRSYLKSNSIIYLDYAGKRYYFEFVSMTGCTQDSTYYYEFKDITYSKLLKNDNFYPVIILNKECYEVENEEELKRIRKQASWC